MKRPEDRVQICVERQDVTKAAVDTLPLLQLFLVDETR
jgi:hypothetical protein